MPFDPHDFVSEPIDRARCNKVFGPRLQDCIGGRLIAPGYTCPHCGSTAPSTKCLSPARAVKAPERMVW